MKSRLNPVKELFRWKIYRVQERPWEAERSTVHSLVGGEPSFVIRSSLKTEQDQRKVVEPIKADL